MLPRLCPVRGRRGTARRDPEDGERRGGRLGHRDGAMPRAGAGEGAGAGAGAGDRAKVYHRIAGAYLKKDDINAAIESYQKGQLENFDKAIERKIKNLELDARKKQRAAYINPALGLEAKERGNAKYREGDYPGAIAEYEEAIKRDPNNAPFRNNLANTFLKMGLFNDAKREVEKALEIDENYVKAWSVK